MKQISSLITKCTEGPQQVETFLDMHAPSCTIVSITHTLDLDLHAVSTRENGQTKVQAIYYAEPFRALAHAQQIAEYGL